MCQWSIIYDIEVMFSSSKTNHRVSRASFHHPRLLLITTSLTATALIGSVSAWTWLNPTRAAARHNAGGDKYLSKDKPAEAIIEYRAALQNTPDSASTFRKLGDAYRKNGDLGRAGDAFRYAADLMADDLRAQLVAGWYSLVQHRPEDAMRYAQRVLDVDPGNTSAARLLANAMAWFGDFEEGLEILQTAAEREPLNATTFGDIGLLEAANGDTDASAVAYERAGELNPTGPWLTGLWLTGPWLNGLGGALRMSGVGSAPPPFQGAAGPAVAADQLPGASETDPPVTVVETGVEVRNGSNPPPTIFTGAIKTGPDGATTVQFTAVDGWTGRPIEAPVTTPGSATTPPAVAAVPEPASLLLLLGGGMVGGGSRWLQRRRAKRAF
jgi:Flp pilus assembly protein TadD